MRSQRGSVRWSVPSQGGAHEKQRMMKVKMSLGSDMRRFSCAATFPALVAEARALFSLTRHQDFAIRYVDCDNDRITVSPDNELLTAMSELGAGSRLCSWTWCKR